MRKGKLYGVGIGCGDPELLTVKATKILKSADIIICPYKENKNSFALEIAKDYINKKAQILRLLFPMTYEHEELQKRWEENALLIAQKVKEGNVVAFITLGDPTVYSTYMYIMPFIKKQNIEVETIPGVTSFCSVASSVNTPISKWEENFCIVPLRKGVDNNLSSALDNFDNIIVMKPSNNCVQLAEELIKRNLENNFVLVSKCGTSEEEVIRDIEVIKSKKIPYFSTMLIKKKINI
ncbi:precorrin-2 C(20)-methyltransferase [Clostridiaceae bacterium M8S5]|nr:precorrin-2 C(20)-methyltransferase [Clostridiaceae bacterium M8S5]